jgi:threonine synthase
MHEFSKEVELRYHSTQDESVTADFMQAFLSGRAADGGLYLPDMGEHKPVAWTPDFAEFAARMLLLFAGDSLGKAEALSLIRRAFTFPIRWREFSRRRYQLELFHGPTGSSKDFGAQLIAQLMAATPSHKPRLVMVASSGESAPALAAAFSKQPEIQVVILHPQDEVSLGYRQQLGCWGDNIKVVAVDGSLERCREMMVECEQAPGIQENFAVSCIDDANIVWLLAQITCCAYSSLLSETLHRQSMNIIIPAGNGGYLAAACIAREMGYPIEEIVAAQNANCPIVDYAATGYMAKRKRIPTMTTSMDIAHPGNWARLQALYPSWEVFTDHVEAYAVSDADTQSAIKAGFEDNQLMLSPHTAVAYAGMPSLTSDPRAWAVAAVTHPAQYASLIESITDKRPDIPAPLAEQQQRAAHVVEISADSDSLSRIVLDLCTHLEIAC